MNNGIIEKLNDYYSLVEESEKNSNFVLPSELLNLKLSNKSKEIFIEDWHKINFQNINNSFPQSPNILEIIDKYLESKKFMHSKYKMNKDLQYCSLLTPLFPKTTENSDYFKIEFQWLYINDIFSKFKGFAEYSYLNVFYTKEEEQYILNYINTNNIKNGLTVLGINYLIRILILYSAIMNSFDINCTEIGM